MSMLREVQWAMQYLTHTSRITLLTHAFRGRLTSFRLEKARATSVVEKNIVVQRIFGLQVKLI